ncbi:hypothetical protein ACVWZF_002483 [Thermostichus sp. OS-CIW-30]
MGRKTPLQKKKHKNQIPTAKTPPAQANWIQLEQW